MPTQTEIDHDYKRLKVLLEDTDSFVLTFVLYRDIKEQRKNAEKLKDRLDLPITEVALKGDNLNPIYTFLDLPKEPRQAIFYTFLGSSLPEGKSDFDKFAGYVNIQREAFTDAPHAVVLWLREEQLVRLMRRAPDFWAWRSGVFDVRGELQPDTSPSPYLELEEVNAFERGELEEQVALYREILKGQLERDEPDLAYVARTRLRLSEALIKIGLFEEVVIEANKIIELSSELSDDYLREIALNNLAAVYMRLGRYNEAEPLFREALILARRVWGSNHLAYAIRLNNLANLLERIGRYTEAEGLYREAVAIGAKTIGEDRFYYATWLDNLAGLMRRTNRYEEAELLYREALSIFEETVGKEHPDYAIQLGNLAGLLGTLGQYDEAEKLFHEAIRINENILGRDHPSNAPKLSGLGTLLTHIGRYEEAEVFLRKAIDIYENAFGKEHPDYANELNNLAVLALDLGRYNEAESLYNEALDILNQYLGSDHPRTQTVAKNYALLLLLQNLEPQTPNP